MYIGLDIGTSGVKAVLFSETGEMRARSVREYPVRGEGGNIELSPDEVCAAAFSALCEVSAVHKDIRAIGISSLGEACILLDEDGTPLRNAILPGDVRGAEYLPLLMQQQDELAAITGLPVNATYSLCKLLWVRDHEPAVFEKTKHVMLFGDYIAYRLTGEAGIPYSLVSRTLLFDIHMMKFPSSFFGFHGLSPALFSPPVSAEEKTGAVHPQAAKLTGLPVGTAVFAGGHDQPCAAMGAGALTAGEAVDSVGTSECITPVIGETGFDAKFIKETNLACEPFLQTGVYNTMAYTHTAGRLLKWYACDILGRSGDNVFHELDGMCGKDPTGLLVLPHFSGSGTPYMDHLSTGAVVGLNLHTKPADLYQAMMESVSYEMKINLELLEENGIGLKKIFAVGGGANSGVWLQYKANIYGLPVYTPRCKEASALGAAICAAKGLGDYESFQEAAEHMVHIERQYLPDPHRTGKFREQYERYRELYKQIKRIYK